MSSGKTPSPWWDKARHADRAGFLAKRAAIARAVREWFWRHGFTEVEPNALAASPGAETHVDAFEANGRYLHTSPEFAMKKLLAAGEQRIFYFGKCWRRGETGPLHAEEFTMLEWYRAGAPYEQVMQDCLELLRVACEAAGTKQLRWRDVTCDPAAAPGKWTVSGAFKYFAGVDLLDGFDDAGAPDRDALAKLINETADFQGRIHADANDTWSDIFAKILVTDIEPQLGHRAPALLYEYPISEAALAQPLPSDARVAQRFELYACGVELANGYQELTDPAEQRARLIAAMDEKQKRYGARWPIDEDFLAALAQMPPASGVAMGFDRVAMLAANARHINDVLWTPTE